MSESDPHSAESLHARLTALEDLEAIKILKARYAMGSDACLRTPSHENAVALADLFTEYAVGDYGFLGHFAGRAALTDAFEKVLPGGTVWSAHYMVNPVLRVDGSLGDGTWDFLIHAVPRGAPAGATVTFYGRYEETYSKTSNGWKIASLKVHFASPPQ
jgi:hypothetical protein